MLYTDITNHRGLCKIKNAKGACVCVLCFNNSVKDLESCVISTNSSYAASNLVRHVMAQHKHDDCPKFFDVYDRKGKRKMAIDELLSQSTDASSITTRSSKSIKTSFEEQNGTIVYNRWCRKVHTFATNCGLSFRSVNSLAFKDMMNYTIENATILEQNNHNMAIGYQKFQSISKQKREELTFVVSQLMQDSRDYFANLFGKTVPSVCVSHDIWESKKGHWLGISLFMMDVHNFKQVCLPIGFKKCWSKKSTDVAMDVENTLTK